MVIISSYLITLVISTVVQIFMLFNPKVRQRSVKFEFILATEGLFSNRSPSPYWWSDGHKNYQNLFHSYLILGTKFGSNQRTLLLDNFAWFLQRQALKDLDV
jgi:hypothetical protein